MKFLNFTFIKLSLAIFAGIIFGFSFDPEPELFWSICIASFALFLFAFFRSRSLLFPDAFFGITAYLIIFSLGFGTAYFQQPEHRPKHYVHYLSEKSEATPLLKIRIRERLKPGTSSERFITEAETIFQNDESQKTVGKILLNIFNEPNNFLYRVGDELLVPFIPEDISSPLNPFQFDYREYMKQLGVEKQLRLTKSQVLILRESKPDLLSLAGNFRTRIIEKLKNFSFGKEEMAVIQALLLGQRQDISAETYQNYAAAGAVHILAVSGLHVGVLLLLLNWLLKPLGNTTNFKILKLLIILFCLWSFALVAGLSPSVLRAVTMFSFLAIGMQLNRSTSVMNSLFLSLFFLLLINPYFIFQVGFQLSYLAVFSIVVFQPKIFQLYEPKTKVDRFFWEILAVSLAAQLGVLPLSLYYFHQFPGLFFLSNLVILPFLGIILGLGILIFILALLELLPSFLADLYAGIISSLNHFVEFIARQEDFIFSDISFSLTACLAAYLLLLAFLPFLYRRNYINLRLILISLIIIQLAMIYEKSSISSSEAYIFHQNRASLIALKTDEKLQVFSDSPILPEEEPLLSYRIEKGIEELKKDSLSNILKLQDKKLLIVDSSGIYQLKDFHPDLVLLINSPKINLSRLLEELNPEKVIADGSNYRSYIKRWEETCQKQKVPFYFTGKKGAFRISAEP